MASPCVICMGQSGKPLAGKRCTASACKTEYSKRMKAAKIVMVELHPARDGSASSPSPSPASSRSAAAESLSGFILRDSEGQWVCGGAEWDWEWNWEWYMCG